MAILKSYIIVTFALVSSTVARTPPFFRRDYHYNEEYDSFYKFHSNIVNLTWENALETCDDEGAKIFYPKTDEEWKAVVPLIEDYIDPNNTHYILVGIRNEFSYEQLITVDSLPTPIPLNTRLGEVGDCVFMDVNVGSYTTLPCHNNPYLRGYVCKREIQPPACPTIDQEYIYSESHQKCYKVNKKGRTWHEAMQTCFMEGGHLVVPDDSGKCGNVFTGPPGSGNMYFVGFRTVNNRFYTVKGEAFTYNRDPQQNNYENNNENDTNDKMCGVCYVDRNNYQQLQTTSCSEIHQFVCEMELRH